MRAVLFTRRSAFQIYCANWLWKKGLLQLVIFENGNSYAGERAFCGILDFFRKLAKGFALFLNNPNSIVNHVDRYLNHKEYYGHQEFHNHRLLKNNYMDTEKGLPIVNVSDINSDEVSNIFQQYKPDLVFVFGTRLIKHHIFKNRAIPFVNMHWGWSPDYRAEGIVTALAYEGVGALGVTVHLLSAGIDSGDILYRSRPVIDADDNFYSIGLKLTLLGTELFAKCAESLRENGHLAGTPQDLSAGTCYSSRYMQKHTELYRIAWKNLQEAKQLISEKSPPI